MWHCSCSITRNAFEKTEEQRTAALVAQFQREFNRRGEEVARRVEAIAGFGAGRVEWRPRLTRHDGRTPPNILSWRGKWRRVINSIFWNFSMQQGTIISSAQWPAKFGYPDTAFETLSAGLGEAAHF